MLVRISYTAVNLIGLIKELKNKKENKNEKMAVNSS